MRADGMQSEFAAWGDNDRHQQTSESMMGKLVVCPACNGTGQKDKVDRGAFAPGNCEPCLTTGWVDPRTGKR